MKNKLCNIICFSDMYPILRRSFLRTQMLHIDTGVILSFDFIAIY